MTTYHAADALGLPERTDALLPAVNTRQPVLAEQTATSETPPTTGQIWPRGTGNG